MTTIKLDGYPFGDRTLEGVYFQADIDDAWKVVDVRIDPEFDEYWKTLNHTHWLKEAREYIEQILHQVKRDFPGTPLIDIEEFEPVK